MKGRTTPNGKPGQFRRIVLGFHLVLGLSAALVLFVIAVTGALLAFRDSYVRWTHPDYFNVERSGTPMSQDAIVAKVEADYAPSRVESINTVFPDEYQYYFMNDRGPLIVNSRDGRVLDPRAGEAWTSKLVITANDLHKKLALGTVGQIIRDIATFEALFLIGTGVILWWRTKRFSLKWNAGNYRRLWDLHNVIGITIAAPVFFLAFTGSLNALRLPESWRADSPPQTPLPAPHSVAPAGPAQRSPAPIDAALSAAETAIPEIPTYQVMLPDSPFAPIAVHKSPGGWSTRNQKSTIYFDRYSAEILRIDRARIYTSAYNAYDLAKRSHTGELFGAFGKAVLAVSASLFAVLTLTGLALGISKLYRWRTRSHRLTAASE